MARTLAIIPTVLIFALIEGIMMLGPEKSAVVVRTKDGLQRKVEPRKLSQKWSPKKLPFIRGIFNFCTSMKTGVSALIDLRVELMYAQGLAQEVRALLDSGVPDRATSLQAIGYKQVVQALEEGLPPEAALGTIQQATRRYAKRQMTWFRANPAVQWLDASAGADEIFRAALQKAADFDSGI